MRRLKRTALSVTPKRPFIDWANAVDGSNMYETYEHERNIYLIEDTVDDVLDMYTILQPHFAAIFEEELGEWCRDEKAWPKRRDLVTFLGWFDVDLHSLVLDMTHRGLSTERYERY